MATVYLVVRLLLGAIFIIFGLNYWFGYIKADPPGGDAGAFIGLLYSSGYLAVVKVVEVTGGVLVLWRRTAALGLVLLGAVLVNILCFDIFLLKQPNPVVIVACVLALVTAWDMRQRLLALIWAGPR